LPRLFASLDAFGRLAGFLVAAACPRFHMIHCCAGIQACHQATPDFSPKSISLLARVMRDRAFPRRKWWSTNMSIDEGGKTVTVGSWVKVKENGTNEEEIFHIAGITKPKENQIATDNVMGQALLGAQPGDEVIVEGPTGPVKFSVLDVGNDGSA
jgi:Transcription elongation factor, GreA/GreB, C-term